MSWRSRPRPRSGRSGRGGAGERAVWKTEGETAFGGKDSSLGEGSSGGRRLARRGLEATDGERKGSALSSFFQRTAPSLATARAECVVRLGVVDVVFRRRPLRSEYKLQEPGHGPVEHILVKFCPLFLQHLLQQKGMLAAVRTVDPVVGTHRGPGLGAFDGDLGMPEVQPRAERSVFPQGSVPKSGSVCLSRASASPVIARAVKRSPGWPHGRRLLHCVRNGLRHCSRFASCALRNDVGPVLRGQRGSATQTAPHTDPATPDSAL